MKTKSIIKTVALCASLAIGSTVSQAAILTETHMSSIPLTLTDFFLEEFAPIPQFNPVLGTLSQVDVTLESDIVSTLVIDNDSPDSIMTIGTVETGVRANFAGLTIDINPTASAGIVTLEGDDSGNTDAPGDGGLDERVFVDLTGNDSQTLTLTDPPDNLDTFIGGGNITPNGDLTALAGFSIIGEAGNVDASVDTMASGKITVVYTYDSGPDQAPVPEPTTIGFFAMGILGIIGIRSRRRK